MSDTLNVKYTITIADNGIMVRTDEPGQDTTIEVVESKDGDTNAWMYLGKSVFEDILRLWEASSTRGNVITMETKIHVEE